MKILLLSLSIFVFVGRVNAGTYAWGPGVILIEGDRHDEISFQFYGQVSGERSEWIASAAGDMFGYSDGGTFYLKQFDRTTTWVGNDNVTFVLAVYGDLISSDTIEAAVKVPLDVWGLYDHDSGIEIENPFDFYLGFMTPESETADGVLRYGWYHLSIAEDLKSLKLLDSGVGLYGENVLVGIGAVPEPTAAMLLLLGVTGLALRRKREYVGNRLV